MLATSASIGSTGAPYTARGVIVLAMFGTYTGWRLITAARSGEDATSTT